MARRPKIIRVITCVIRPVRIMLLPRLLLLLEFEAAIVVPALEAVSGACSGGEKW